MLPYKLFYSCAFINKEIKEKKKKRNINNDLAISQIAKDVVKSEV